jgi:hypothetical protein
MQLHLRFADKKLQNVEGRRRSEPINNSPLHENENRSKKISFSEAKRARELLLPHLIAKLVA